MTAPQNELPILAVVGPTGVGKTRVAVALCERFGGEIVGADSVQIYRELDIGSNKPSAEELRGVRHHMLDLLAPDEAIDAARYAELADEAIADIARRGAVPVVAGGTGLWLRALLRGLVALPKVDPALRAALEAEWDAGGGSALHARLREVDPRTAARVHPSDRLRIVRALEVHSQTGRALGELHAEHALGAPRYRALTVCLTVPSPHFEAAIEARTRDMLARGWLDEVRGLVERHGANVKPLRSVGYRQLVLALEQGWSAAEIERQVVRATRLYARRQRTWFRTDPNVDLTASPEEALSAPILARLSAHVGRA
jgi:tRNA dimethylallyltransferase